MQELVRVISRWMRRTPVQTFVLCPLAVMAAETVVRGGHLIIVPWGAVPLMWGYLQYRLVGRYRGLMAGGGPGMQKLPERIINTGPYRYTRNPMYLGHLIFLLGLAIMFWSIFGLILFAARCVWFHRRVLHDEKQLGARFGPAYADYQRSARRWIPGII